MLASAALPTVSIGDASALEGEQISFPITLSVASAQDVTVFCSSRDGTAGATQDFEAVGKNVTILAGQTSASLLVPIVSDIEVEGFEVFYVDLTSPVGATIDQGTAIGTIRDDSPAISIADASALEGNQISFPITLSVAVDHDVTVYCSSINGTAAELEDFEPVRRAVTIPAGQTSVSLVVPTIQDTRIEGDETLYINLSNPSGATIDDGVAMGTITDDEQLPTISIADAGAWEGDQISFPITLSAAVSQDVTVYCSSINSTAVEPGDFEGVRKAVTIPAGQTSLSLVVPTIEDAKFEGDEVFFILLSNASGATLGRTAAVGTITDDEQLPAVSISDADALEGDQLSFLVLLSRPISQDVTVFCSSRNWTAIATEDFEAVQKLVTIPAGQTSVSLVVPTIEDTKIEGEETFYIDLSNPTGATIGRGTGTGTILDDEQLPTISIADAIAVEGDQLSFAIALSAVSSQDVSVTCSSRNVTATATEDYEAVQQIVTIPAGQTSALLVVPTIGDNKVEGFETFYVDITNPTGATIGRGTATGGITDDEQLPTISIADPSAMEGDQLSFPITLSTAISQDVTVYCSSRNGTAREAEDFVEVQQIVTIPAGQTRVSLVVTTIEDTALEGDETFFIDLSNPTQAAISGGTAMGTIVNDDIAEGFETGDFSQLPWRFSYTGRFEEYWGVEADQGHSGAYAARSGGIWNNAQTSMSITLATDAGDISFYRKVSSQTDKDFLRFFVDRGEVGAWSGKLDWEQVTVNVPAGIHTFTWTYQKDAMRRKGSDAAWIDDVVFPPLTASALTTADAAPAAPQEKDVDDGGSDAATVALYDPSAACYQLSDSNTAGVADRAFGYGSPGANWQAIAGDWDGDGVDTAGLYDPAASVFYLRNSNDSGQADVTVAFGEAGKNWIPLAGDWDGDGVDSIGVFDPTSSVFYLRNTNDSGFADRTFGFGVPGSNWNPVAGDWDGDGSDTVALYDPGSAVFYLRNVNETGFADLTFSYGSAGQNWVPLAGDWTGSEGDRIGLYDPAASQFHLRNTLDSGVADIVFGFGSPGAGWLPVAGRWDASEDTVETDTEESSSASMDAPAVDRVLGAW